ncbi:MAG TPA: tyrosine-protein phosphatase [Smithella sp.]|nr:tyrosine-protein phosphatase [Smithella sp.]
MRKSILRNYIGLFFLAAILLPSGCATCKSASAIGPRPLAWAVQMKSTCNVSNFYRINKNLYRSAQPTEIGFAQLADPGVGIKIKTIIDLREFHGDEGRAILSKLRIERVPMNAGEEDSNVIDQDVITVMKIVSNQKNGPFLIHCLYGSDRTGLMSAMYRIIYQRWTKDQAIDEMVNGGYGFHTMWYNNIIEYIQRADVDRLRKQIHSK